MTTSPSSLRDPVTPLWYGAVVLRWVTLGFALGALLVHLDGYVRPWLAWTALGAMVVWTCVSSLGYLRPGGRTPWLVVLDVLVTCGIMLTSPFVLSDVQYEELAPLITTVWAAVPPVAAGARFGAVGGVTGGLVLTVCTAVARLDVDLDVARDGVLLTASGLLIGVTATTARRSQAALARAMRTEAATAERERLARSIHDSVLQVLARVRRRGSELGGEAAELARLAGEQEIALRALVTTEPAGASDSDTADLRSALQLLSTSRVQIAAPAGEVTMPSNAVDELVAAVREALSNVEKHAGPEAKAWVLLEDLGEEIVLTVRDDGPGIPSGRLEQALVEGHLGVAQSIRGRVAELGGTCTLVTAPGEGTEWELRVPRPKPGGRAR
ncbi:MacS family sensor histidine kinase [Saccharomonospora azurea]|uniref:Signal transduction histidine kinase n=1 Tax=Saccharomonospora azurea NA-128 TaxID=882081 RepID=H8GAD4_9PSEU|nr:ATP-binding protein [Saccharomonospora azurea]EHK84509.1 signal transduction histidine kinase [Saccharomonospora azurea SZMC 14600]EHY89631.1 signal transduction histidine kinase [Saccharomonospora azurea NA-128]